MEPAITARTRSLFDRYKTRISVGVLFSLLVHGFILSLRLGIPGLGLPGLELPWSERRAQMPALDIRIVNPASIPNTEQLDQRPAASLMPKPQQAQQKSTDALSPTDLPDARMRETPLQSASNGLHLAKALQSTPALAQTTRKKGTPPPDDQSAPTPARSQAKLIALDSGKPSSFTVPASDLDEWWRSAPVPDSTPLPLHPTEDAARPAIALQSHKLPAEPATAPAPAVQKPVDQESFERPDQLQAKEPEPTATPTIAMEQAVRTQGEEIAQQEAARTLEEKEAAQRAQDLETKKMEETRKQEAEQAALLLAAQKLEQEKAAQRAQELAAQKQEEIKKQELEEAERQAKELEARRQAEEVTRRQAAALALQKQAEEAQKQAEEARAKDEQLKAERQAMAAAAQKQAEEKKQAEEAAAARLRAEAEAAAQRESDRIAAAAAAAAAAATAAANTSGNNAGNANGANDGGNRGKGAGGDNLIGKALSQVGKIAASPPADQSFGTAPAHTEDNSRRRSIFGSFDHDTVLALYIQGWRVKVELNGDLNYSKSSRDKATADPIATVVVRSDGSVEDVVINRSSGRPDLDEAVKRIAKFRGPYSAFPASMARRYDVIEIRCVWKFEDTLRIQEEMR